MSFFKFGNTKTLLSYKPFVEVPRIIIHKEKKKNNNKNITGYLLSHLHSKRRNYCNSLLINLPASLIQRLQSVQNAAARLIFNMRRSEHITDALISLHWFRVPEQIIFKVATLTYHALQGTALPYLVCQFSCVVAMPNRRRLRSASTTQLDILSIRLPTVGSRAFPVAGASVWNSLPDDVTSAPSLPTFRRHLKRYLFCRCYNTI